MWEIILLSCMHLQLLLFMQLSTCGIPDKIKLLPDYITESVSNLKTEVLREKAVSLDLEEAFIALCISAKTNPAAQMALEKLKELRNCEMHLTPYSYAGRRSRIASA